jgi:DNA-binding winged helix-turn-helix (wHTH) protein/tetratricopeptide (TPR) repeat protein
VIFVFDKYALDPERRELRHGDVIVPVQPQVFDLLEYLIRNRGHVVSRDNMLDAVWAGRIVSESTLATRINAARSAIGDDGESQRLIRTLPRKGLRFVGDVRVLDESPQAAESNELSPPARTAAPRAEAERRHLTVMACDFVGLRELATQLDPEELSTAVRICHDCCTQIASRWGGALTRLADDGATILFSYPQAHEDDAERAIRAGLDLIESIRRLETGHDRKLAARVGVATGLVVVGIGGASLTSPGLTQESAPVGEAPTLAAALRRVAEPGTLLIATGTHNLLGGLFEYEQAGPFAVSGFSNPVPAWRVVRSIAVETRFEAMRTAELTRFFNREEGTALLFRRWREAKSGKGGLVLISGEPAIGKSRIIAQFTDRLAEQEQFIRLLFQCSPHYSDTPLHPFIAHFERVAGLREDDTPEQRLDKLEAAVAIPAPHRKSALPLLAALLSIDTASRYPVLALSPVQQRRQTLGALLDQIEALARRKPMLLVFEDAQWVDPTSTELLDLLSERIRRLPVLSLITFRPEFEAPWAGLPHTSTIALERLSAQHTQAMVESLTEGQDLSREVLSQIVAKTDGVPLFVEELTKNVVESLQPHLAHSQSVSPPLSIPSTLEDTLRERLDRLSSAKDVAQVGAAIGRSFSHKIIAAVMSKDAGALQQALDRLAEAKLILPQGAAPDTLYTFKHMLMQEAAYESLLRSQRLQLHARIAAVIENEFPEIADTEPELLAYHCSRAELADKAAGYWLKAGTMAVSRSANLEAINHLRNGLARLDGIASEQDRTRLELQLQLALGQALIAAHGYTAEETTLAFKRAGELVDSIGDTRQRYSVLYGIFVGHLIAGQIGFASAPIERMTALATAEGNDAYLCMVYRLRGGLSFFHGDLPAAHKEFTQAIALYSPEVRQRLALHFGPDSGAAAEIFLAMTEWLEGLPDSALRNADSAINHARQLNNGLTIGQVLTLAAQVHYMAGNYDRMLALSHEGNEICERIGIRYFGAICRLYEIWAKARRTRPSEHIKEFRDALKRYEAMGCGLQLGLFHVMLAQLLLAAGRPAEAVQEARTSLAKFNANDERWWLPEAHRTLAEAILAAPKPDKADAAKSFQNALDTARQTGAMMLELRAATGLAAIASGRNDKAEAKRLLAAIIERFGEGLDSADMRAAKAQI